MPKRRASPPGAATPVARATPPKVAAGVPRDGATPADETARPGGAAYAPVAQAGFQATTTRVQEMHHAISRKTFDVLTKLPGLAMPSRLVQGAHDAVTQGVYAAIRHGGGALIHLAGQAERLATDAERVPGPRESAVRSALNAVVGDRLADAGSALAVPMGLYVDGERQALLLEAPALAFLQPRVCVFIHGLGCDEHSWHLHPSAWDDSAWAGADPHYGRLLASELGVTPLYLRYNTGKGLGDNAVELAVLLTRLFEAAPPTVTELVLIGHSMGGLVARLACEQAAREDMPWLPHTAMLVCLGSPHLGAPLERLGHVTSQVLGVSDITRPLQTVANVRSRGIQDLRHGLRERGQAPAWPAGLALRLVSGSLSAQTDDLWGEMLGRVLGDGLVPTSSATDLGLVGDIERVQLAGLGHMDLLNHPRAYALIRRWLGAAEPTPAAGPIGR